LRHLYHFLPILLFFILLWRFFCVLPISFGGNISQVRGG